ncbi:pyrin domain-containing protein 1-like [Engraulis encrasicolus]|uniref:pyrin domain-containing protein 1-like n=1 Tax=Engraulis encrasicolus TaxID=184585 RepID=UPI002FD00425
MQQLEQSFDVQVTNTQQSSPEPVHKITIRSQDYMATQDNTGQSSTSSSTRTQTVDLFSTFDELRCKELKRFKAYLSEKIMEGFEPVPRGQLEQCDETDLASKMKERYGEEGAVRMTLTILRKMELNDLANRLEESITLTGQ